MGINFLAAAGGAALQVAKDLDKKEDELRTRTQTILDEKVRRTRENQKDFDSKNEKAKETLSSIVELFPADDPYRYDKARKILEGGNTHAQKVYGELYAHKQAGGDINKAYEYIPNADLTGGQGKFSSVDEALQGLVKMRPVAEMKIAEGTTGMTRLFGIDSNKIYKEMSKGYEEAGMLIPANASNSTILKDYGSGTINYKNLKKSQGTLKEQYDNISTKILNLDKDSPTYDKELKSLEVRQDGILSMQSKFNDNSVALKVAEAQASGKSTGITYSEHRATWNDAIKGINTSIGFKSDGIASEAMDGKKRLNGAEAIEFRNKKLNEKKKAYARGLLDDKGDFINSDSEDWANANGFNSVISEIRKEQFGAEGDTSEPNKVPKKKSSKDLVKEIKDKNKTVDINVVKQIKSAIPNISETDLYTTIEGIYPKQETESEDDYMKRISSLIKEVSAEEKGIAKQKKDKEQRISDLFKPEQPKEGNVGTYQGQNVVLKDGKYRIVDRGRLGKVLNPTEIKNIKKSEGA